MLHLFHSQTLRRGWLRCLCWVALLLCLSGCSREILLRDLSERDANEIVAVLYSSSIEAQKMVDPKGKSFSVEVRSAELARAVAVLRALGLPKSPRTNLNEVFRSTGFAPTPFEERVRYLFGLAQEIERTISLMQGVFQTRVHVVTPDWASKLVDLQQAKASIFVSYDDRYDIETLVPRIRKLVSDSIEGLSPQRVEILAIPSRVDLKQVTEVPLAKFVGVRVHQSDFPILVANVGLLLGLLVLSGGMQVLPHLRRRRQERAQAAAEATTGQTDRAASPG